MISAKMRIAVTEMSSAASGLSSLWRTGGGPGSSGLARELQGGGMASHPSQDAAGYPVQPLQEAPPALAPLRLCPQAWPGDPLPLPAHRSMKRGRAVLQAELTTTRAHIVKCGCFANCRQRAAAALGMHDGAQGEAHGRAGCLHAGPRACDQPWRSANALHVRAAAHARRMALPSPAPHATPATFGARCRCAWQPPGPPCIPFIV